jgi:hypothetical protein
MITIRQALCGLFLLAGATTLWGQNRLRSLSTTTAPASGSLSGASDPSASRRTTVSYYEQTLNQGLFGAPVPAPAPTPKAAPARKERPSVAVTPSTPASDPLADYNFTGVVTIQGRESALIENKLTRAGVYLGVGDRFLNGKITDIDGRRVTLALNGTRRSLARFENYRFTPLDASAPFLKGGASAPAGTPGAPGMPNPGQGVPPPPGSVPTFPPPNVILGADGHALPPPDLPAQMEQKSLPPPTAEKSEAVESAPPVTTSVSKEVIEK